MFAVREGIERILHPTFDLVEKTSQMNLGKSELFLMLHVPLRAVFRLISPKVIENLKKVGQR